MPRRARVGSEAWSGRIGVPDQLLPEAWPEVDADALPDERRELFVRRKRGIELYFEGADEAELRASCGFGRSHIYRLIMERCLKQHEDGNLYGWRGALPHQWVKAWARQTPPKPDDVGGGAAGALRWVFESPAGQALETSFAPRSLRRHPLWKERGGRSWPSFDG